MRLVALSLWGGALAEASAVPWHTYLRDSLWSGGLAEGAAAVPWHTCLQSSDSMRYDSTTPA